MLPKDKSYRQALFLIVVIAIALRCGMAFYLGDSLEGDQQLRVADQRSYHALAQSLLAVRGYSFDRPWYPFYLPANTPTAFWSFAYPVFLTAVYGVAGVHPLAARLVQAIVVGAMATWMIFRLGRRLFGETVGLSAAGLSAVYAYFVFHDAALMTEAFFITGVIASLEVALALADSRSAQDSRILWMLLGGLLGATALLRQTILLWAPFLYLWVGTMQGWQVSARKGLVLSVGVMAAVIAPWTVRNYVVYGMFLPLNSNAGYALYSANHPHHGVNFDQDYAAPLPQDLVEKGLNEAEWNNELTRRGIGFILQEPLRYMRLSLDRVGVLFKFWFSSESSLSSNVLRIASFGLYLPFFVAGLWLSRKDWRRCSLVYLFVAVFSLLHILTWASIRYRLPIDAALMPFAGLAVWMIYQKGKK